MAHKNHDVHDNDSSSSSNNTPSTRQDNNHNNGTSSFSASSDDDSLFSPSEVNDQNNNHHKVAPPPKPPISNASNPSPREPTLSPPSRNPPPDRSSPPSPNAFPPPPPPPPPLEVSPPPRSSPPAAQTQNGTSSPPPPSHFHSPPPPAPPPPSSSNELSSALSPVRSNSSSNNKQSFETVSSSAARFGNKGTSSDGGKASIDIGKYVGYTLAAVFFLALVALTFIMFRKKKSRADVVYATPYIPPQHHLPLHLKPGIDRIYYGHGGVGNGSMLSSNRSNRGSARNLGSMRILASSSDLGQQVNFPVAFSYEEVLEVTNSFSYESVIGEGGFGHVYKGTLPDGKVVAVKKLKVGSVQGEREFRAEVEIISRVHHRHLVSLVGYCICEEERLLIYEYVPNGTLHHHLHGSGMPVLTWDKRCKIAIGAAKGLAYLHEDCSQKIIHRDIKSANILLDDTFEAQVADFGLARLTDTTTSHVSTRVVGTFGYMAPEYATSGKLTDRSDVFSFGVVLLELLTGRKPVDDSQPLGDESLVEWARPHLLHAMETHDCSVLVDPRLQNQFVEAEMFRMIEAAAACVRHSAPKRPRMVQVVRALDSGAEISDLSNGVKYGHSTTYDSNQYDRDIMMFHQRMANASYGGDSDFYTYSKECSSSREMTTCGSQNGSRPSSSSELESIALNRHSRTSS
ncbi:hypothetical protein PIB30_047451 [Stylosanthes scabra]|uniref:non-specific serine/threonine protein kinase n=1 Tax=Stylosanthes scabra TaxID=79078 RepID=A0ABU6WEU9_9FABA|nr:hypothetical protein [Stylosanthes scabra]